MTETIDVRKYELMLIFSGDLPEADFAKELDEMRKMLKENTKAITFEDSWGRRDFAYRIKKQKRGYYVVFDFAATPESLIELKMNVKLNSQVLRYLLIAVPEDYQPVRYKEKEDVSIKEPFSEKKKKTRQKAVDKIIEEKPQPVAQMEAKIPPVAEMPIVAGKEEEEKLKSVEKKLEQILENPDIEIK